MVKFTIKEWNIELKSDTKPRTIVIEPSLECNLKCKFCFRTVLKEKITRKFIDLEIIEKLSRECENYIERIVLTGFGEPTLHPHFHDILEILLKNFKKVIINTNGIRLGEYSDIILKYSDKVEIVLSFHEEYCLDSIVKLLDIIKREHKKIITRLIITLDKNMLHILPETIEENTKYFSSIVLTNIIPICSETLKISCIDDHECEKHIREYLCKSGFRFMFTGTYVKCVDFTLRTSRFDCPYMSNDAVYIRCDGLVSPCMFFSHKWKVFIQGIEREVYPVIFGDVVNTSLVDIWRSEKYAKFRFRVLMRQFPSCLDCDLVNYCTFTLSNEHDCWGNSPSCAFCPFARNLAYCPV